MPGNELNVARFLFAQLNRSILPHLGLITSIGMPKSGGIIQTIVSLKELEDFASDDSRKKADVYVNGRGVSVKQIGASFPFNRLQRAELVPTLAHSKIANPNLVLQKLDRLVVDFHNGRLPSRDVSWDKVLAEDEFRSLIRFLMMRGSPNLGLSKNPAEYILEAPPQVRSVTSIRVFSFDEYFETYKSKLYIAIRRQWIGQLSESEHKRAVSIARKPANSPWVFTSISGSPNPRNGVVWRAEVPVRDRRTVYLLFISKVP